MAGAGFDTVMLLVGLVILVATLTLVESSRVRSFFFYRVKGRVSCKKEQSRPTVASNGDGFPEDRDVLIEEVILLGFSSGPVHFSQVFSCRH